MCSRLSWVAASLLAFVASFAELPAQSRKECAVTHVANAGVLFETNGRKFLFDAPIEDTPSQQLRRMERGAPPFENISAILTTHWHYDHITPRLAAEFLKRSPSTKLVSSNQVVELVRQKIDTGVAGSQLVAITPDPGTSTRTTIDGVPITVIRIRHNPSRNFPNEHVGFVVEGCKTVLHTGDADPVADNFTVLRSLPKIDVGLLPSWYLMENNRAFVASSINPARIFAIHMSAGDPVIEARIAGVPNLTVFHIPGTRVTLRDP